MAHRVAHRRDSFIRRHVLYPLKMSYGEPVEFIQLDTSTNNVRTGEQSKTYTRIKIRKAPVLPLNVLRKFVYDLAYIAANKNFTEGGFFDMGSRFILVDGKDVPKDFNPNLSDHIIVQGTRWTIRKIEEFEHTQRGWIVGVVNSGEIAPLFIDVSVDHSLEINGDPGAVIV